MTGTQKLVKLFGFALAACIIFVIVSGLVSFGSGIFHGFDSDNEPSSNSFRKSLRNNYNNISRLEIEISRVNLTIENGEEFNIETSNKYITSKIKDSTLYVTEKKHHIWERDKGSVIITIPSEKDFTFVGLEAGASSINIENFTTDVLMLNLGAGTTTIDSLLVNKRADIDGGAGSISIRDGAINNLDLDMGIGNVVIASDLSGDNDIDCGVGNLTLNLAKEISSYNFNFKKAIGNIKINGENIKNVDLFNDGEVNINIDGGIGTISVNTMEEKETNFS